MEFIEICRFPGESLGVEVTVEDDYDTEHGLDLNSNSAETAPATGAPHRHQRQPQRRRVVVVHVSPGSPADRALPPSSALSSAGDIRSRTHGLRPGDEIVEINGRSMRQIGTGDEARRLFDEMPLRMLMLVKRRTGKKAVKSATSKPQQRTSRPDVYSNDAQLQNIFNERQTVANLQNESRQPYQRSYINNGESETLSKLTTGASSSSSTFTMQTCTPSIVHEGYEVRRLAFRKEPTDRLGLYLEPTTLDRHVYYQVNGILPDSLFSRRRLLLVGDCLLSFNGRPLEGVTKPECHQILTQSVANVELEILRAVNKLQVDNNRRQHMPRERRQRLQQQQQEEEEEQPSTKSDSPALRRQYESTTTNSANSEQVPDRKLHSLKYMSSNSFEAAVADLNWCSQTSFDDGALNDDAISIEPGQLFARNKFRLSFRGQLLPRDGSGSVETVSRRHSFSVSSSSRSRSDDVNDRCDDVTTLCNAYETSSGSLAILNSTPNSDDWKLTKTGKLGRRNTFQGSVSAAVCNGRRGYDPDCSSLSRGIHSVDDNSFDTSTSLELDRPSDSELIANRRSYPLQIDEISPTKPQDQLDATTIDKLNIGSVYEGNALSGVIDRADLDWRSSPSPPPLPVTLPPNVPPVLRETRFDFFGSTLSDVGEHPSATADDNERHVITKNNPIFMQENTVKLPTDSPVHASDSRHKVNESETTVAAAKDRFGSLGTDENIMDPTGPSRTAHRDNDNSPSGFDSLYFLSSDEVQDFAEVVLLQGKAEVARGNTISSRPEVVVDAVELETEKMERNADGECVESPREFHSWPSPSCTVPSFAGLGRFVESGQHLSGKPTNSIYTADATLNTSLIGVSSPSSAATNIDTFAFSSSKADDNPSSSPSSDLRVITSPPRDCSLASVEAAAQCTVLTHDSRENNAAAVQRTLTPVRTVPSRSHQERRPSSVADWVNCSPPGATVVTVGTVDRRVYSTNQGFGEYGMVNKSQFHDASSESDVTGLPPRRFKRLKLHSSLVSIDDGKVHITSQVTPVEYGPFMLPKQRTERGLFQVSVLRTTQRVDNVCGQSGRKYDNGAGGFDEGLGIAVQVVADGVIVSDVSPVGPVGRNRNVRPGDYLLAVNGIDVSNLVNVTVFLQRLPLGPVHLVLYAGSLTLSSSSSPSSSYACDSTSELSGRRPGGPKMKSSADVIISTRLPSNVQMPKRHHGPVTRIIDVNTTRMKVVHAVLEHHHNDRSPRLCDEEGDELLSSRGQNVLLKKTDAGCQHGGSVTNGVGSTRLPPEGKENDMTGQQYSALSKNA